MGRRLFIAAALLVIASTPLRAQTLAGVVIDSNKTPVSAATIAMRDSQGREFGQVLTDPKGAFSIEVPGAGKYMIIARRVGFANWSQSVDLKKDETVNVQITLSTTPVKVAKLTVTGRSTVELGRNGWAKRKALGVGVFLTGDEIRAQQTATVAEALRIAPGLTVVDRIVPGMGAAIPMVKSTLGSGCLFYFVNRQPLQLDPDVPYEWTLNQMVGPGQVAGVEVYREYKEVPAEFRQMVEHRLEMDQTSSTSRSPDAVRSLHPPVGEPPECGVVLIWTNKAW